MPSTRTTFEFQGITYVVRPKVAGGWEYREEGHLGGSWLNAVSMISNTSYKLKFRRLLANAIESMS